VVVEKRGGGIMSKLDKSSSSADNWNLENPSSQVSPVHGVGIQFSGGTNASSNFFANFEVEGGGY
jgi:hypothetical protein